MQSYSVSQQKKVPIFYRSELGTNDFLYRLFPLEGVNLFCSKFRDSVQKDKAVYLPDNNTEVWKLVFDWIQRCLDNGAIEDFDVVSSVFQKKGRFTNAGSV